MLIGGVCGGGAVVVVAILGRRGQKTVSRCGALVFGVGTGPKNFWKIKIEKKTIFLFQKNLNYVPVHNKCNAHEQEKNDSEEDTNDDTDGATGVSAVVVDGVG